MADQPVPPVRIPAKSGAREPVLPEARPPHDGPPVTTGTPTLRAGETPAGGATVGRPIADAETVIARLNAALATALVCALRYKRHASTARGLSAEPIAAEFARHSAEEQTHSERIAARIAQLGGDPDFSPSSLTSRAHLEYDASADLVGMIRVDLIAERIAVDAYGETLRVIGDGDPTTRRLLESVLAMEMQHANDLAALLANLTARRP